jgi:hypothetical protein
MQIIASYSFSVIRFAACMLLAAALWIVSPAFFKAHGQSNPSGVSRCGSTYTIGTGGPTLAGQTCAITTAVPFLTINPDSRSGATGDAGVATGKNANAIFMNASTLAFTESKFGFALNYVPWLRNIVPSINLFYLPAYYNFGENGGVINGALTFFSLGDINLTNATGQATGIINPSEFAFQVGYARKVTNRLAAGVNLRYIYSGLTGATNSGGISANPGQSFSGDFHIFNKIPFTLGSNDMAIRWGFCASNIGAKMSYTNASAADQDFLPTNLRIGYSLDFKLDEANVVSIVNDFNKLMVPTVGSPYNRSNVITGMFQSFSDAGTFSNELAEVNWGLGLEYDYDKTFAARLGYFYEDPDRGNRRFISAGAGLKFNVFALDVAYLFSATANANQHPLHQVLRFSLNFDFGEAPAN